MTTLRLTLILLLCGTASFAIEPEVTWRALSDTHMTPSAADAESRLNSLGVILAIDVETMGTKAAPPAAQSSLSPELAAQMRSARDQTIAAYEKQLSQLDEKKDAAQFSQLKAALDTTRASYASLLGENAPAPSGSKNPTTLVIPVFGASTPTLVQALANLQRLLALNSSADALAAFKASPDYASAARCAGNAAAAVMTRRDMAALAAWLRAHELEPDNPHHLLNLAGLALRHGLPRHALSLTEAAEARLKNTPNVSLPLLPRAQLLNHRGFALILLRKPAEAEKALREALTLEPEFSEAQINLAHALYQQDVAKKKTEAVRLMRFARHRTPPPAKTGEVAETKSAEPELANDTPAPEEADVSKSPETERAGRPLARDVFDLSHGKSGSIATIRIPQTIADAHAMWASVRKLKADTTSEGSALSNRLLALNTALRKRVQTGDLSRLSFERAQDIFWYITVSQTESGLRSYFKAWTKATQDPGVGIQAGQYGNPFGSKEYFDEENRINETTHDYRARCAKLYALNETFHASWLQPIHRLDTEVNRYARRYYVHATALAANLSDPMCHEYAMLLIRSHMNMLTMSFVRPLETVCRHHYQNLQDWGLLKGEGSTAEAIPAALPEADWCPAGLRGEYSVGLSLELFSVALNCEKVGFELSAGEWVKAFLAVDQMFDGSGTFFVGVAGESSVPIVGVLGITAALKGGLYLSVDKDGSISDFGLKVSRTSTVGVGPVSYSREIENTFSFIPALPN